MTPNRPLGLLVAVLALVVGLFVGVTGASAATPNDTACRQGLDLANVSHAELLAYDACRFDKLDAAVAAYGTSNETPTPTATPSATVTPTAPSSATSAPTSAASATPTATPSPTIGGSKPGPSNTGVPAGTVLTPYTGPKTITVDGTIIDGKDVTSGLTISAKNVLIKNSRVHGTDSIGINNGGSGSVTVQDSEVYGFGTGIVYGNVTVLRVNLHDTTFDGIKLSSNASVRDSWIHDPKPTGDAHYDGIQVQNGVVNTTISGNTIDVSGADANTALFLCPDLGPSTDGPLTVAANWLNGGNFTVAILDGNNGQYFIRDIRVTDNRFGADHRYGYDNRNVPITQSGNTGLTGAPLDL